jgi:hypothetical protein
MGGKIWSKEEEDAFWRTIIPRSPKRLGTDQLNDEETWDELAEVLTKIMGDDARRKYTALSLCAYQQHRSGLTSSRWLTRDSRALVPKRDEE